MRVVIANCYSASELLKRSAAQLVYFRRTGTAPEVTKQMKIGEAYQCNVSNKSREAGHKVSDEMGGCYTYGDNAIYFCIDIVREDCFVEVKSVLNENGENCLAYPTWYFEASILQCAVYKALLMSMNGDTLVTPKFRLDAGYADRKITVDKSLPYKLKFGEVGTFIVNVTNAERLIGFLKEKINALKDYDTARAFDSKYKHKEYSLLKDCFTYKTIE